MGFFQVGGPTSLSAPFPTFSIPPLPFPMFSIPPLSFPTSLIGNPRAVPMWVHTNERTEEKDAGFPLKPGGNDKGREAGMTEEEAGMTEERAGMTERRGWE